MRERGTKGTKDERGKESAKERKELVKVNMNKDELRGKWIVVCATVAASI